MENKDLTKLTEKYLKETDDNIIGVSYGYNIVDGKFTNEKVLSFTVKEKLPIEQVDLDKLIPTEITYSGETFNTDVIEGEFKLFGYGFCYPEHYTWWEYDGNVPPSNRGVIRPLKGGVQTTNYTSMSGYYGTLGFLAVDNETNSLVGVSNNHVLVDDAFLASERTNASIITNVNGDISTQPPSTSYPIGHVKKYVPITRNGSNYVDGALTTIVSGASYIDSNESWKMEGLTGITTPMPFATTSEIDNLLLTDPLLYSSGARSGAKGELNTKLKVSALNATINIAYNKQGVDTTIQFSDCIVFIASGTSVPSGDACFFPLAPGDSGSALIADIGGTKKIIGLCFAGSAVNIWVGGVLTQVSTYGIACRIDRVANELNISAYTGQTVNYSTTDTNNFEECVIEGLDNRRTIIKDGKTFWQLGLTDSTDLCTGVL